MITRIKTRELDTIKDVQLLKNIPNIVLWGAGEKGTDVLECFRKLGMDIYAYIDSDNKRWGTDYNGKHILSPYRAIYELKEQKVLIIACVDKPMDIKVTVEEILNNVVFKPDISLISYWAFNLSLYIHCKELWGDNDIFVRQANRERRMINIKTIYHGLVTFEEYIRENEKTLWILMPGKTGGTSVASWLKRESIPYLFQHFLDYPSFVFGEILREPWEDEIKELTNYKRNQKRKIIIAVREPISRDLSAFWQAFSSDLAAQRGKIIPILREDIQKTYDDYLKLVLAGIDSLRSTLGITMPFAFCEEFNWFDEQIKRFLEVDVFSYDFDCEKGYDIIETNDNMIFIYKLEFLSKCKDELKLFCGAQNAIKSEYDNAAKDKAYYLAYQEFQEQFTFSKEYFEHYYVNNEKFNHFYSEKEREIFKEKWISHIC